MHISFDQVDLGNPTANLISQAVLDLSSWVRGCEKDNIKEYIHIIAPLYADKMSDPDDDDELSDVIDLCYRDVICSNASLLCSYYVEYMRDEYGIDYTIIDGSDGDDARMYNDYMWEHNMNYSLDPEKIQEIYQTSGSDCFNIEF